MNAFASTVCLVLISLGNLAYAESGAKDSFARLKSLAGEWEGTVTTDPPEPSVQGKPMHLSIRVTSMGNAVLHEMRVSGREDDPITMFYLDEGRLFLTHYCDAGNRPRMTGGLTADGNALKFALLDVAGPMEDGHMHDAGFTFIDADRHAEDWIFMLGEKGSVRAHFDLHRKK